jgi:hypothetical protein
MSFQIAPGYLGLFPVSVLKVPCLGSPSILEALKLSVIALTTVSERISLRWQCPAEPSKREVCCVVPHSRSLHCTDWYIKNSADLASLIWCKECVWLCLCAVLWIGSPRA